MRDLRLGMCVVAVAFINVSFHGFIEFDETGRHIACVNSDAIIDGPEDSVRRPSHDEQSAIASLASILFLPLCLPCICVFCPAPGLILD